MNNENKNIQTLRLNIVTKDSEGVFYELVNNLAAYHKGMQVYIANRPAKNIVEYDLVMTETTIISLENIREALMEIPDWDIRLVWYK